MQMNLRRRVFFQFVLSVAAVVWSVAVECQGLKPQPLSPTVPNATSSTIPEPGEIFRDCPDCSEMVAVPAGDFKMGSNENMYEKPEHRVVIASPFAIGRREVTFEEWDL